MEYIKESDLQKYELVLDKLDKYSSEVESLQRKQERLDHKLFALKLRDVSSLLKNKLVKLTVKVFHTIFELYDLYGDTLPIDELKILAKYSNHSYCFVQVHIFPDIYDKLTNYGWMISASLENEFKKTVKLSNVNVNPVSVFIPFVPSFAQDILNIDLLCMYDDFWEDINVDNYLPEVFVARIPINMSYHFKDNVSKKMASNENKIHQLNLLYRKELETPTYTTIQHKFLCRSTFEYLFNIIIQHCFHLVDIRSSSVFVRDGNKVSVKLSLEGKENFRINFDEKLQILTLDASTFILYLLKVYFSERSNVDVTTIDLMKIDNKLKVLFH